MTSQSRLSSIGAVTLLLFAQICVAQPVYKIVGPDGKVTFSDKPPAISDKSNVTAPASTSTSSGATNSDLPYELRQVTNRYPVTLYTATACPPCDTARSTLKGRGIPFAEKTISTPEDHEALIRIAGDSSLPFLTIGSQKLRGYSDSEWSQFLTAAGYPTTSLLPKSYRFSNPSPLVVVQKTNAPQPKDTPAVTEAPAQAPIPAPPSTTPSNPAGITF